MHVCFGLLGRLVQVGVNFWPDPSAEECVGIFVL